MIKWTASNNSSFLDGSRSAKTLLSAVRAARRYVTHELYGDGVIQFYDDGNDTPFRIDACTIFTGYRWSTELLDSRGNPTVRKSQ